MTNKIEYFDSETEQMVTREFDGDFVFCYDVDNEYLGFISQTSGRNWIYFMADMLTELYEQAGEVAVVKAIKTYMEMIGQEDFS